MYTLNAQDGNARQGTIHTKSGPIETPFFMPVATKMSVKHLPTAWLKEMGNTAVISNAFVLHLKPGDALIKKLGGIKKLMGYHGINVTDSGGFQMYSPSFLIKATDEGVWFRNPYDGTKLFVTPEKDMEIQLNIDSDIAMCLDVMPNFHGVERAEIEEAVRKTTLWAKRCKQHHDLLQKDEKKQLLFGISQGGIHLDLREQSLKELIPLDFDGYSCGGLGMGEPVEHRYAAVALQRGLIPKNKPLYLMGIGSPVELVEGVARGADMFDSRFPTQNARRGTIFTSVGKLRIKRKEFEEDTRPLDEHCDCFVCKKYTRAYIRYLLIQKESPGYQLATYHQLHFLTKLCERMRSAIKEGTFAAVHKEIVEAYQE